MKNPQKYNHAGPVAVLLAALLSLSQAPQARADFELKDGFGEEITVKNSLLAGKKTVVKDRLGNRLTKKKGLFGSHTTEVNLLGNKLKCKKGMVGSTEVDGSSIFGDKIKSKKGISGKRNTQVDVSGIATVIRDLFAAPPKGGDGSQTDSAFNQLVDPGSFDLDGSDSNASP